MSLITTTNERPSTVSLSNTFIPQVDSESIHTFETSSLFKSYSEGKQSQVQTTYASNMDETMAISEMILDSRVLKTENKFDIIEQLLHVVS